MLLSDMEGTKLQWTLDYWKGVFYYTRLDILCELIFESFFVYGHFDVGIRNTYWISCNYQPNIQHSTLDRNDFPSHLVVKPRDLNKLLGNFKSSIQEITVIATDPTPLFVEAENTTEGKVVELRSYKAT